MARLQLAVLARAAIGFARSSSTGTGTAIDVAITGDATDSERELIGVSMLRWPVVVLCLSSVIPVSSHASSGGACVEDVRIRERVRVRVVGKRVILAHPNGSILFKYLTH